MFFLYNGLVHCAGVILSIMQYFNPKIKLFVQGRRLVWQQLEDKMSNNDQTIWFHAASLGEFEQGIPVMEEMKKNFPNHKLVVTFFSPSGYEVRKNNSLTDVTIYLPLDTKANAKKLIDIMNPSLVFFIKYEFWPNYLKELHSRQIKTYLISGIFRENQLFFKWYGGIYRKALRFFEFIFVQNNSSKELLHSIGVQNVAISGDTRFDRVAAILERDNQLETIKSFTNNTLTVVIGSSWPVDEQLFVDFINNSNASVKYIFAPHLIKPEKINALKNSLSKKTILYSEFPNDTIQEYDILIIDSIGILTKVYSYADIAYIGGGFGTAGLHNILEPATFGVPVIIGPNYAKFQEAVDLVNLGGCISVNDDVQFSEELNKLIENNEYRAQKGKICKEFVHEKKGATKTIINHILNENVN